MAKVPYSPVQSVSETSGTVGKLSVSTPLDAFGGGIADAQRGLSRALEGAGDEIFKTAMQLQAIANDSEAKKADADYVIKQADLHAEYQSLQGQAAVDARPAYVENLRKLREDIGQNLNPAARRIYDSTTRQQFARAVFNSAGHAASQLRQSAKSAAQAQVEANILDAGTFADDDVAFARGRRSNVGNISELGRLEGWSPEQTQVALRKSDSAMVASRIIGAANNDPFKAQEWLKAHKESLTPADREKAENIVNTRLSTLGAREIDAKINADLFDKPATGTPEKGLDERVQEAKDTAERVAPGNVLLSDAAVARVRSTYTGRKRDAADTYNHNRLNVASAVNGDYNGIVPTTIESLRAISPAIAKSYDDLPADKKPAVIRALANNAKGDVGETEERYRKYLELRGQANSMNDAERLKFLDTNVAELDLPRKWRTPLLRMQESLTKSSEADPRVTRAMRVLLDAGIAPRSTGPNDPIVNQFRGALQMALEDYQEENKKAPDAKIVQEIGVRLANSIKDPNSWSLFNPATWLSGGAQNEFYKMSPDQATIDKIKADPRWKQLGVEPPEELIRKHYLRERWKELYKGASKAEKAEQAAKEGRSAPKDE